MFDYLILIPLLPLIGFLFNGFFGKRLGKSFVSWVGPGTVGLSFALALKLFFDLLALPAEQRVIEQISFPWVISGDFGVNIAFYLDALSAVMMLVVCGVGFLIHVYSIGYMHEDPGYARYFSFLNLFEFSMLVLVLANNLVLMFLGWEGVGLCSYLLIGFWFSDRFNAYCGSKAFIVNRIGDFGFLVGIFLLFWALADADAATVNFRELAEALPRIAEQSVTLPAWLGFLPGAPSWKLTTLIGLCFFLGAVGKSAQIPLYVWLPDAMAGPTPVSALIHAATMVTAGVYMVCRLSFLYAAAPAASALVAWTGGLTALFAATIALAQTDIKRVLAYSTVSQLGYMFLAAGCGGYAAAIFHLVTHAFFKALLFLGAGSVIHALGGEQDIRKMGRLKDKLPITSRTFYWASLANAGIIPLAGFWSKDEILAAAFAGHHYFLWV